ncbi:hypothetical protein ABZ612_16420 [Streptomyces avermitilis]|uniref:hypothetical protein n=1 Tax=Streptomyces avermitilis TaxID=33903 RepID=UPI0033C363F1
MTTTTVAPVTEDEEFQQLGERLLRSAKSDRDKAGVQALVEEETLLATARVRAVLVTEAGGKPRCHWESMLGRQYTLGLDDASRSFLALVLSMVGIGQTSLAAVQELDERRLAIILRAIARLAGNDTLAVGTRL